MNARCKVSGPVPPSVCRPVGVIPLGQQIVMSSRRKASSHELRQKKRATPTAHSNFSTSSNTSSVSNLMKCKKKDLQEQIPLDLEHEKDEGQDIKFIDCNATPVTTSARSTSSRSSSAQSSRKGRVKTASKERDQNALSTQEILDRCQESDPYKVFEIELHGAELTSIPDLEKFRKLRLLDISGNQIKKINGLEMNKDLRDIKLYDNKISSIEGFENLKDLSNLQLQHNCMKSIGKGLCNLRKLQVLRLDSNKLCHIETVELLSCSAITVLNLSNNQLESLEPLKNLPNLEELSASGNRIRKIGDLSKCRRLHDVDLSHNQLADLTGIANLPNLQILDVSHNQLKSIKSAGKMKSLEELNIDSNQVSNFDSFSTAFPKLQILCICDNMVSSWDDVCSLSAMSELVELFISGNPFTLDDGEMPTYHLLVQQVLPNLEIIDGAHIKRSSGQSKAAPLMRPMSASSIISVKQVDAQLQSAARETESLMTDISDRFTSLRTMFDKLPSEAPPPSVVNTPEDTNTQVLTSRANSRLRIREAQEFAAANFEDDDL